jgi:hypothetical protein
VTSAPPIFNDFAIPSALIETPLQNPHGAASPARKNDSAIHDSVENLFYAKS